MLLSTLLRKGNDSQPALSHSLWKAYFTETHQHCLDHVQCQHEKWLINSVLQDGCAIFSEAPLPKHTICVCGPLDLK